MKIERIDLYWVKLPLIYPWRTAYGEDWDIHSTLVRLEAEQVFCRRIKVDVASHSPQMDRLAPALLKALAPVQPRS